MENPSPSTNSKMQQILLAAFKLLSTENKLKVIRTAQQLVRKELLGDGNQK